MARGASTVADCPVSRLENRSTSASNRRRISSTVDFLSLIDQAPPEEHEPPPAPWTRFWPTGFGEASPSAVTGCSPVAFGGRGDMIAPRNDHATDEGPT